MNKVVLLVTIFASFICASAVEFNSKEFNENVYKRLIENKEKKDKAVISEVNKYLESVETKNDAQKLTIIQYKVWVYDQTTGSNKSFEDLKKYSAELLSKEKFEKQPTRVQTIRILDCWYKAKNDKAFCEAMYNAIKTTENGYMFSNSGFYAYNVGKYEDAYNFYMANKVFPERCVNIAIYNLKDLKKAFAAAQIITTKNYKASVVKSIVNHVLNKIATSDEVDQNSVKLFLQKVNIRYSRLMKEDENTWAPIIGDVRMTLSAY